MQIFEFSLSVFSDKVRYQFTVNNLFDLFFYSLISRIMLALITKSDQYLKLIFPYQQLLLFIYAL